MLEAKTPLLMGKQDQLLYRLLGCIQVNTQYLNNLDDVRLPQFSNQRHLASFLQHFDSLLDNTTASPAAETCEAENSRREETTPVDPLV
jgi:hypothetical protein